MQQRTEPILGYIPFIFYLCADNLQLVPGLDTATNKNVCVSV